MFEKYKRIVILDLETSGLDFKNNQIIELGAIVLENENFGLMINDGFSDNSVPAQGKFVPVIEVETLVKCPTPLDEEVVKLTNITDDMLVHGIEESELLEILLQYLDEETLFVAYNVSFDKTFIYELYDKFGMDIPQMDVLDPLAIYQDRSDYPHKLKNAIETYGVNGVNSHRAVDDAKATFAVLKKMILQSNNVEKYINKLTYYSKYGIGKIQQFDHVEYIPFNFQKNTVARTFKQNG